MLCGAGLLVYNESERCTVEARLVAPHHVPYALMRIQALQALRNNSRGFALSTFSKRRSTNDQETKRAGRRVLCAA